MDYLYRLGRAPIAPPEQEAVADGDAHVTYRCGAESDLHIGGLAKTSVTHTALIQAISPVIVMLLAAAMRIEAPTSERSSAWLSPSWG